MKVYGPVPAVAQAVAVVVLEEPIVGGQVQVAAVAERVEMVVHILNLYQQIL